jgi:RecJ-like exonuclease
MRIRHQVPVLALLFVLGFERRAFGQRLVLADSAAAQCSDQICTIEGTVASVHVSQRSGTTFFNFGAAYPHQTFTAVAFRAAARQFPDPKQWEGKRVRVTGQVRLYQGKAEVILVAASQLVVAP